MYILFDIGGTKLRIAASTNLIDFSKPFLFDTPQSYQEGMELIKNTIQDISGSEKILGGAGGIAGPLNKDKSSLVASPHLTDWVNKPLQRDLSEIMSANVHLQNDSSIVGLGEAVYGAGKGNAIVAYITVSTGFGGARFVNGKIDTNSLGFEPGHQIINLTSPHWVNDNKPGYLEDYVSGKAVVKRYQKKPEEIKDEKVWIDQARTLAIGLNNIIVIWSPDIIVLGGSTMDNFSIEKVIEFTKEYLRIFPEPPKIVRSQLGLYGGLHGAMAYLVNIK